MYNPQTLIYPHVVGSTVNGPLGKNDTRFFAKTQTNNNEAMITTSTYWYIPEEGEPVLVIEIDDEAIEPTDTDITVRIRRNDGLLYEGNQASQWGSRWPTDDERDAYADWSEDVANASTTLGFREWIAAREEDRHA